MRRSSLVIPIVCCALGLSIQSPGQETNANRHFMFAWTGDVAKKGNDFLAVSMPIRLLRHTDIS
jgi:hypothetical protein